MFDAKIENFRWYELRHTFASRLREANVQHEDISYSLGHASKSITSRYAHSPVKLLAAAVALLDSLRHTETDTGAILAFRSVSV